MSEEYNYIQKFWYKGYMFMQNLGFDEEVGNYNGYTIYKEISEDNYKEVIHAQTDKVFTLEEMKERINELPKLLDVIDKSIDKIIGDNQ